MKYLVSVLVLCLSLQAQEYINWQSPTVKAKKSVTGGHNGHAGRKAKKFQLNNLDSDAKLEIFYIMPTLEKKEIKLEDGLVSLPRTGMENYHALVVNQTKKKNVSSSIRYIYSRGRPSKVSPTKITQFQKSELEIAPAPLPREHDRYHGSKSYNFKLLFKGKSLPNQTITFSTSNGSQNAFQGNEDGEFSITMPNDFKSVKVGKRKNKAAEFTLKAFYMYEGITYTTTLAMPYHVNPTNYWQSVNAGALVLILGLIIGLYLFRNINKKKKRKA